MAARNGIFVPSRRLALILGETILLSIVCGAITSYTDVVTAQVSALNARITLSQLASNQQASTIALT